MRLKRLLDNQKKYQIVYGDTRADSCIDEESGGAISPEFPDQKAPDSRSSHYGKPHKHCFIHALPYLHDESVSIFYGTLFTFNAG